MERDVRYITVGVVVAFLVAALVAFAGWTAGTFDRQAGDRYTLYAEGDVHGLSQGSDVRYRGMEVGRVLALRVSRSRPDRIKVDIEVQGGLPVTRRTRVTIRPQGITGLSFISLRTPTAQAPPPTTPAGERYPVLRAEASRFDRLMEEVPALVERLNAVADRAQQLLSADNRQRVATLLRRANAAAARVEAAAAETDALAERADETLAKVDRTVTASADVLPELEAAMSNFRRLSGRLDRLVARNEANLDRFTGEGLGELHKFLRDGRQTLEELGRLARELEQDPSRLFYAPRPSGVELPR